MKVAMISGAVIAALAAGAIATPSFAQPYGYGYANDCRQDRGNAAAGTIIGGIAGAVLGSNLAAHHGGRSGGAAIGAVAGALLGNSIGRSSSQSCDYRDYDASYRTPAYSSGYYAQPSYGAGYYTQPAYGYRAYDTRYSYDAYSRPQYDRDRDHYRDRDHDGRPDRDWRSNYR